MYGIGIGGRKLRSKERFTAEPSDVPPAENLAVASLQQDPKTKTYRVRFRFRGVDYNRSLKTTEAVEARGALARVQETLRLLSRGRLDLPGDVDPAAFILSDGRLSSPRREAKHVTIGRLLDDYSGSLPEGVKEASTRKTERIHLGHFRRHLSLRQAAAALGTDDLQRYANARLKGSGKAGGLSPTRSARNWRRSGLSGTGPRSGTTPWAASPSKASCCPSPTRSRRS